MDIKLSNSIGLCCLVLGLTFLCRAESKMTCPRNCSFFNSSTAECHQCILGSFTCPTCPYWTKQCRPLNIYTTTVIPTTFQSFNLTTSRPIPPKVACTESCIFTCVSQCKSAYYAQNQFCQPCSVNCTQGCEGNMDNCTFNSTQISKPAHEADESIVVIVVPIVVIVIIVGFLIVVFLLYKRQCGIKKSNISEPLDLGNKKIKGEEQGMLPTNCAAKTIQDLESIHEKTRYATDPTMFRKCGESISNVDSDGEQEIYENVPTQSPPNNVQVYAVDKIGRPSSEEQIAQLPSPPPIPEGVKVEPASWNDFNISIDGIVDTEEIYHLPQAPPLPVAVNTSQTKEPIGRTVPQGVVKTPEKIVQVPEQMDEIYINVDYKTQKPCEDENLYYSEDPLTEEIYENLQSETYYKR